MAADSSPFESPAEEAPVAEAAHRLPLPGGGWALWRTLVLRGAGFPARQVLRLAAPAAAAAADRALDAEGRLEERFAEALQAVHAGLDELRRLERWSDRELRRPLMKAMQALTAGKLPQESFAPPECAPPFARLKEAWAARAAALEEMEAVYRAEVARVSREISAIAQEDSFREAVLWQNRHAVETALDELARPAGARSSRRRQHEELVASYLQRYCTKNDTIGFFGPVSFAQLADEGEAIDIRCGPGLLEARSVYFETWCIDALAEAIGRDPAVRPWLAPRLKSSFHLEGGQILHRPFGKPVVLPAAQAALLSGCDGRRVARDLARDLVAAGSPFQTEEEVFRLLEDLFRGRVVNWSLEIPPELHPDHALAAQLERMDPGPVREEAEGALAELREARDRVARAAGDPAALAEALRGMEDAFTRRTGAAPRHRHGQTYAARGLLYEDCRRDIAVEFGPELARRLAGPVRLLLKSSRWLAGEIARRLDIQLRAVYEQLSRRSGAAEVDCHAFFTSALSAVFLHREREKTLAEIGRDLKERWARVLGPLPSGRRVRFAVDDLEARFPSAFEAPGPAWTLTRFFSPDVMIAASGEEAFRRGEFELVLGEVHSGHTLLWSCFISQHPHPERIAADLKADTGVSTVVVPQVLQQGWPRRVSQGLILPDWYHFQFADVPPCADASRLLPAGELVIEEVDGRLRARTRDGRVGFAPIDLFGTYLTQECSGLIGNLLQSGPHLPRLSFDDVVISRESWHFTAAELEFAQIADPAARFLSLRAWARALDLPRFCFFKVAIERKPCYLDLDSPISGDLFARFVRAAREAGDEVRVSVSEMYPGLDRLWLSDAANNLYTSELRLAALELA